MTIDCFQICKLLDDLSRILGMFDYIFFSKKSTFCSNQSGFFNERSTIDALVEITNQIGQWRADTFTCTLHDLRKQFYSNNHEKLLAELKNLVSEEFIESSLKHFQKNDVSLIRTMMHFRIFCTSC